MDLAYQKNMEYLRERMREDGYLLGVAAGSGITARYAEAAGCHMLLALNSGKFRQMGQGSLAGFLCYANSNEMVMEFARKELLPTVRKIPIIFGLNGTDPTISLYDYIRAIKRLGFAGVNNYPTVGMLNGQFREALEEEGISYEAEIETIRFAHYCGLITVAFAFDAHQAAQMAEAGADIICAHFGLTSGGNLGAKRVLSLEKAKNTAMEIFRAAEEIRPEIIKIVYGGPVKTPVDAQYMYYNSGCQGFIGGSVFARIPVEKAIFETACAFRNAQNAKPQPQLDRLLFHNGGTGYTDFVKEYINEHYMEEIKLNELARVAHLTPTYLSALFTKEVGCGFRKYLIQFRMKKARRLITEEKVPLARAAQMVGYQDYAQFSKMYKKYNGELPSAGGRK